MRAAAPLLVAALLLAACGRTAVDSPASPMARDQLFFVGQDPDPLLLALVFQRHHRAPGASLEAKAFTAWRGAWVTPFWERVELDLWPGDDLDAALAGWQRARTGQALRLSWSDDEAGLEVKLRGRSSAIELSAASLPDVATGEGPHGPLAWRAGPGLARVDGREIRGVIVAERLTEAKTPDPVFGRYEMWLLSPGDGDLVLGRRTLGAPGRALRVSPRGSARLEAFDPEPLENRLDPTTGFELPVRWRLGDLELIRRDGEEGRGHRPDGGPAVYDASFADQPEGGASALILHLQDRAD